ncbi:hypothetical protein D7Y13_26820 [Corallococcus praedator]|uniref:DUF3396 domain-containing protein n=1 Tax=Corallococcus praedator TaxID=2316724 RepID=A0ABX9QDU4_9BACT|nr:MULTISPECIES: hypothetical protein [Corallococcus]RKH23991.1 hypothetical protein D7X75_32745 [Corallococcus sp. CA031C]RKI00594.1 hypothetical protein D7Y13_26820 [Corallococcus praedator]
MDFTELKIAKGCGTFHVNQFRIHFSIPGLQGDPKQKLPALVGEFIKDFPRFFNGTQQGLTENRAAVAWSTKQFEHNKTLRFLLDFKSEKLGINLPDVHSDWVHVLWKDANKGFAAQTVKRNFAERSDYMTSMMVVPWGAIFTRLNSYHFLAGRRSWVFGVLEPGMPGWRAGSSLQVGTVQGGQFTAYGGTTPVFYLESAAVERYSMLMYELMESGGNLFIDIRKAIVSIWSILLANYVQAKGFRLNVGHPKSYGADDGAALWDSQMTWRGVYRRQAEFKTPQALYAKKWVSHLLEMHPALKGQSLSESEFKGFGGGKFGGGGSDGRW